MVGAEAASEFSVYEASLAELHDAMEAGTVTSVELVGRYLSRIGAFDLDGARLNSLCVLNPNVFAEARAADERRARGEARALDGIPFTVKDSFMVAGLTVAAGSPAFAGLIAQWDAFTVGKLREAGAVLIGKTNMPPMADGGMQRGLYGRAESPYNPHYLPAAYASGSSNGSGVSVASNFAAFGMGEETVSSGRSPASNNALCAYTPSWGLISIRGNWPLFPARDVVVPHTRTMADMLRMLDVLVQEDEVTRGDFWRHQTVLDLPKLSDHRPATYSHLASSDDGRAGALNGVRLGVPAMYLGNDPNFPIAVRQSVRDLWDLAKTRLEELGATVEEVDFPLIEAYEGDRPGGERIERLGVLPEGWMTTEFEHFLAFGWDDFLRANGDPELHSLADIDADLIFPTPPGALPDRYEEVEDYENRYRATVAFAKAGIPDPRTRPDFAAGLRALVTLREQLFTDWLTARGLDAVVFPANADVAEWNADTDPEAADRAWANGVFFSNGNYALRHLGIPTVTVPMGTMADIGMPVGLTFAGNAYQDVDLLRYAVAFDESATRRTPPPLAPELPEDRFAIQAAEAPDAAVVSDPSDGPSASAPEVTIEQWSINHWSIDDRSIDDRANDGAGAPIRGPGNILRLSGRIRSASAADLRVTVNGTLVLAYIDPANPEVWAAEHVLSVGQPHEKNGSLAEKDPLGARETPVAGNPRFCDALAVAVVRGPGGSAGAFVEVRGHSSAGGV